jgi:hypothetical protein
MAGTLEDQRSDLAAAEAFGLSEKRDVADRRLKAIESGRAQLLRVMSNRANHMRDARTAASVRS